MPHSITGGGRRYCVSVCVFLSLQEAKCMPDQFITPGRELPSSSLTFHPLRLTPVLPQAPPVGSNKS